MTAIFPFAPFMMLNPIVSRSPYAPLDLLWVVIRGYWLVNEDIHPGSLQSMKPYSFFTLNHLRYSALTDLPFF